MDEFLKVAERKKSEFKALKSACRLNARDEKLMLAIQKRLEANEKNEKL